MSLPRKAIYKHQETGQYLISDNGKLLFGPKRNALVVTETRVVNIDELYMDLTREEYVDPEMHPVQKALRAIGCPIYPVETLDQENYLLSAHVIGSSLHFFSRILHHVEKLEKEDLKKVVEAFDSATFLEGPSDGTQRVLFYKIRYVWRDMLCMRFRNSSKN